MAYIYVLAPRLRGAGATCLPDDSTICDTADRVTRLVLWAQGQAGGHQQQPQAAGHPAEVFCSHLSTGQLCTPGTAQILKLEAAKRDRWTESARKYNQAVATATKQFLEEAKGTLSPQEFATVEKWFAHEVNDQLNRQVLAAALAGHKH